MNTFHITEPAFRDIDSILAYLVDVRGAEVAYAVREELFEAFGRLSGNPGVGHRRPDLTSRQVSFFAVQPYLVIFDGQSDPLTIHAVLHSARDVKMILRRRTL